MGLAFVEFLSLSVLILKKKVTLFYICVLFSCSTLQLWNTKIDATSNYWGLNSSLAVRGRIKDQSDDVRLLEVNYVPYEMNNQSILLKNKCPPGWDLVGETCYIYIGAPMTFHEAKSFCQVDFLSVQCLTFC